MEIVFLGTSCAVPTKKRNLSAVLLEYLNEFYLFDCGEGSQRQMRTAGINFMRIDNIFLTHLHADHFMGLPGLIQSMDFMERERTLHIHGPKGLKNTLDHMMSMGSFNMDYMNFEAHEVEPGPVLEGKRFKVECFKTQHTPNSIGFVFEEKGKRKFLKQKALELGVPEGPLFSKLQQGESVEVDGKTIEADRVLSEPIAGRKVVYSGDSRACDSTIEAARNADVLIHDSTFADSEEEKTAKMAHSTARQAAQVAKKAQVGRLYLTHLSQRYTDPSVLEGQARQVFEESYVAEDFERYKIEKHDI